MDDARAPWHSGLSPLARLCRACCLAALIALPGCGQRGQPPAQPPPPEVSVIKVAPAPVTLFADYAGQTEAVDTVEIRARVGGILEQQAYVDGADVQKDDLLFVIDPLPYRAALNQAKASLVQAQASLQNSRQNLARAEPLASDHAISQQEYDATVAKERSDAATVEQLRAQIEQAELNLGYTTIRAPREGVVSKALIRPGGLVNASTTLLTTLYSLDPIRVNFVVSEQKAMGLRERLQQAGGGDFRIKLIDGSDYPHPGRLDFIDAAVDPQNGTLQARVLVPNPERSLRPGQFVRVVVPERDLTAAIRVPQRAVTELLGQKSVFVVGPDNKATPRQIVATARVGNDWVVEQGLNAGESVVVDGISKVRPGAPVKPAAAPPEQAAGNAATPFQPPPPPGQDTQPPSNGSPPGKNG